MSYESSGYKVFKAINFTIMLLIIVVTVYPYLHITAKALNEGYDTMRGGLTIFPRSFTWENFSVLLRDATMLQALYITISRVVVNTFLSLIVTFTAAYVMSKPRFPFKNTALMILVIPMFIHAGLIPTYVLYSKIGLLNNYWVYILPSLFSFFNMILIRTYIRSSVPESLEESAKMDGAGEFTVMLRIILPLCMPILAAITLFEAVGSWNDWTTTLYFVTNPDLFTLQYKLMQVIKESESLMRLMAEAALTGQDTSQMQFSATPESLISAQIVLTTVPIIMVYPFLQRYFVNGIMIGAVKE
ncbi:carbohydrate ABC transporter permease [Paenibacillus roseipurpureus]|uniref:Carbohydrate ABC transporter permease n=1 Tax=Paenibacillus roseopurpureus TaxID=2918901 RepID=A0AA96LQ59_9BACL|nr:carbohydrate ABC transporter permease [Paenibacillus sp. MBLB1832]WNR45282.1 carbohydrate ABC transporter permease [Paenibacillus sp. MBLB1832]